MRGGRNVMNSIRYPDMFSPASTNVVEGREASAQDLILLLSSEKGEMLGDPFFGVRLRRYVYEQNNQILQDILREEIFEQIRVFSPQLTVGRNDISIAQEGHRLVARIRAVNKVDYKTNMYEIELFNEEER